MDDMKVVCPTSNKVYEYPKARYADETRGDNRRKNGTRKGWQVAEVWDKYHEIARLLVLGRSNKDIAEIVGVSAQQVSNVKNSPVIQDKLAVMRAVRDAETVDVAKEISELAPIAVARLREALETGQVMGRDISGSGILKEANNMLDREIGKPTQRIDSRSAHVHFTRDDIEDIKARARELAMVSDQTINED